MPTTKTKILKKKKEEREGKRKKCRVEPELRKKQGETVKLSKISKHWAEPTRIHPLEKPFPVLKLNPPTQLNVERKWKNTHHTQKETQGERRGGGGAFTKLGGYDIGVCYLVDYGWFLSQDLCCTHHVLSPFSTPQSGLFPINYTHTTFLLLISPHFPFNIPLLQSKHHSTQKYHNSLVLKVVSNNRKDKHINLEVVLKS